VSGLDQDKMQQLLEFCPTPRAARNDIAGFDETSRESEDDLEVDHALAEMMTLLQDKAGLSQFQTRRSCRAPYATIKTRCVLAAIFGSLGLNGLADDMGLGKSARDCPTG